MRERPRRDCFRMSAGEYRTGSIVDNSRRSGTEQCLPKASGVSRHNDEIEVLILCEFGDLRGGISCEQNSRRIGKWELRSQKGIEPFLSNDRMVIEDVCNRSHVKLILFEEAEFRRVHYMNQRHDCVEDRCCPSHLWSHGYALGRKI